MRDSTRMNKKLTVSHVVACVAAVLLGLVGVGTIFGEASFVFPMVPILQYAEAQTPEHGLGLTKVCNKVIVGSDNDCFFTVINIDSFNDTIHINDVNEVMLCPYPDPLAPNCPQTKSASADPGFTWVAINDVAPFGDTTCVVGPIVPCNLGHDDRARGHAAAFLMPTVGNYPDRIEILWVDLCDNPNTVACDPANQRTTGAGSATRVINPSVDIIKTASPTKVTAGTNVTYTYNVTNTGDVALTNCAVTDNVYGSIGSTPSPLAPGASAILVKNAAVSANVTNTGSVTCNHQLGQVSDSDDATVRVINPAIDVEKTCEPTTQQELGTINWKVKVTNVGDVSLDVTLTDSTPSHSYPPSFPLAPGASSDFNFTDSGLPNGNYTNTVTAVGKYQLGEVTDTATASCNITPGNASTILTKTADRTTAKPGDTITYTVTENNTGTVAISNVTVTDSFKGLLGAPSSGDTGNDGVLGVGETWTWSYTRIVTTANCNSTIHNDVTATGTILGTAEAAPIENAHADVKVECPPVIVGGEILGTDISALLVAGALSNASWMIPTLAGVAGAAILTALGLRRRNTEN